MWSEFANESVFAKYREMYNDPRRTYHNWDHILGCYDFLEQNDVPWNYDLDLAVLFHDAVYDELPDKELRSAQMLVELLPLQMETPKSASIVLSTIDHSIAGKDGLSCWMIKADLHQLADLEKTFENYYKIYKESRNLYGVSLAEFADANHRFMHPLRGRIRENAHVTTMGDSDFWWKVHGGVQLTLDISSTILNHTMYTRS